MMLTTAVLSLSLLLAPQSQKLSLEDISDSFKELAIRINPAVVQILASGYNVYPDEIDRVRAALATNERWNNDYLPKMRPLLIRQDSRQLTCRAESTRSATNGLSRFTRVTASPDRSAARSDLRHEASGPAGYCQPVVHFLVSRLPGRSVFCGLCPL